MGFGRYGFIVLGTGEEDPAVDRAVIERGGLRTTVVAVPRREKVTDVAAELAADGVQSIELCGAFTAADIQAVRQAIDATVPVGAVHFDMDAAATSRCAVRMRTIEGLAVHEVAREAGVAPSTVRLYARRGTSTVARPRRWGRRPTRPARG
jgi:hypothetical protein